MWAKHFEEPHDQTQWREAVQEEAESGILCVAAPTFPHFHCSTTLCVAPNFTYLASVFAAVIPKPTCLLTRPPIIGQTFLLSRNSSKKVRVLPALQLTPFYSSWLKSLNARCIVFYASSPFFASFSIILFTHSFTDFNGQEEIPEVASYPHSFSPQCSHTPARSKNLPNIEPHANRFLYWTMYFVVYSQKFHRHSNGKSEFEKL